MAKEHTNKHTMHNEINNNLGKKKSINKNKSIIKLD